MKRNNKGFSLVELLIAIAVSSIVLSALVTLIVQAVRSYSKQTALAQVQSDADISLNQISKNILEANEIQLVKTTNDGKSDIEFYFKIEHEETSGAAGGTGGGTPGTAGKKWGYWYDSANKILYYTDNDDSDPTKVNKSVVCDNVEAFNVQIKADNFTFDSDDKILSIPKRPQIVVTIKLKRMNEEREVQRTYVTRNVIDEIYMGKGTSILQILKGMKKSDIATYIDSSH